MQDVKSLIGKRCGFKISTCHTNNTFMWAFSDGSLPDGFTHAVVDSAEWQSNILHLHIHEYGNPANDHYFHITFERRK